MSIASERDALAAQLNANHMTATHTPSHSADAAPDVQYRGAHRLEDLAESQTLALAKRVRQLRAEGRDLISLTLGEPDFDTPDHIREAAIAAIREGFTHYPPVAGIPELRAAAAEVFRMRNGIAGLTAENIVVSTGAKQSLFNALMCLVNPGEEVIVPTPYWVSYSTMIQMAEGIPVLIHPTVAEGMKLTPAALEAAITPRTRALMINSPSNPHGVMYSRAEVAALVQVLERHPHVMVISDEIYELIAYDQEHVSFASFESIAHRVATFNGMSKAYAMTGWRLGLMAAPRWLAELCERYQGQVTSGTSSISQRAALAALTGTLEPTYAMVRAFRARRDLLCRAVAAQLPDWKFTVPEGAFYLYPDVSAVFGRRSPAGQVIQTADDYAAYLLDAGGVSTVPGTAFGTSAHLRLSYACSEAELTEAVRRMAEATQQLR
jgi:aspartate aminotransferase